MSADEASPVEPGRAAGPRRGRRPARAPAGTAAGRAAAAERPPGAPLPIEPAAEAALGKAFNGSVPASELVLWAAMRPDDQTRALARLAAVLAWELDAKAGSADAVAKGLEISRSRFYRMVSEWRSRPSLSSLGARAPAVEPRSPRADLAGSHAELQRALPGVVRSRGEKEGVASIVRRLRLAVAGKVAKTPGDTALRAMVERELRRVAVTRRAGNEVVFDLCAVGLLRPGGLPYAMFACVDVATAFVLGAAVGDPDDSRAGHAAAAADALARLAAGGIALPWAPAMARAQVTPGVDREDWQPFFAEAGRAIGSNVQEKGAGERFGTDLRRLLGESLGRVRLVPFKAGALGPLTISVPGVELTPAEARARLEAGVVEHDAGVLAAVGAPAGTPPPALMALLRLLAG